MAAGKLSGDELNTVIQTGGRVAVRTLPITWTIVRPAVFMEMLTMPGFGLDEDRFTFFARPDQSMQFIAVADIGKIVATVFADPDRFGGQSFEIAGDRALGTSKLLRLSFPKPEERCRWRPSRATLPKTTASSRIQIRLT
ncbi:NmrA family NAD(P)-binding protein [Aurantimonas aggregata]|uniref:NmrA family NAD(P)-binding protein n=2 Tax=Aurantimonas aggregata TaxID=2047720 RepID=A0A6L9MGN8_9HYPH|nr:NmrA family NAD(P)-binding protein [Aurantimonas aggregata]